MGTARRAELAQATFETLQQVGLRNTTVARVSKHAGLAQGLVHHYFQSKSAMVEAAIRLASSQISREAIDRLNRAGSPRERLDAIIDANLAPSVFNRSVAQAWMAFGVEAVHDERQRRVLNVIERRMQSNLRSCLRPLAAAGSVVPIAGRIRMMINGAWLQCALSETTTDPQTLRRSISESLDAWLASTESRTPARPRPLRPAAKRPKIGRDQRRN